MITIKTPTINEEPLTLYERVLRLYNEKFHRHLILSDQDFWMFSKLAYRDDGCFQRFVRDKDRRRFCIAHFYSTDDGLQFYVILSRLTKDVVISFRGTDEWKDWLTNVQILRGKKGQFQTAIRYLEQIFSLYPKHHFYLCGHSLGGALAQYLFVHFISEKDLVLKRAVTFNSAGVRLKQEPSYHDLPIDNYVIMRDIVGTITGAHYGKVYQCVPKTIKGKFDPITFHTHSLDQFMFDETGSVITAKQVTLETG